MLQRSSCSVFDRWTSDGIQVGEGVVGYKIRGTTDWHSEGHKEIGCATETESAQQHKWLHAELVMIL